MPETLLGLVVVIAVAAVLLWALSQFPAMDGTLKAIIKILVVVIVAISCIFFLAAWVQTGPLKLR